MYSKSSINRVKSLYEGIPLTDIVQIQSWNRKKGKPNTPQRKKAESEIKRIFKKPNISGATALAYARLADQYMDNIIVNPTKTTINYVKSKFGINLQQNNTNFNLLQLKNLVKAGGIPPKPMDIDDVLSRDGLGILTSYPTYTTTTILIDNTNIKFFPQILYLTDKERKILRRNGYSEYRVLIKVKFDNGDIGYVSSPYTHLSDYRTMELLWNNFESKIVNQDEYEYQDEIHIIAEILEVEIYWR